MKQNLKIIVALLLFSVTAFSQQTVNREFKNKTLQVYQYLEKNRIPTGLLLDFGMDFTNLEAYNGTLADSTYTNALSISDCYKTLLMCRARQVNTGFIDPVDYAKNWYTQRKKNTIILSGLYFKYNKFRDNAYPASLNYNNNRFSDKYINGVWQNPYEEKQLFVMAPAINHHQGLKFQVKLPSNLFLSNYPATIQNIQLDFQDGLGYRVVAYDQLVNVAYTTAATYTWKYKITLTTGQTLLSHSRIIIEKGINAKEIGEPLEDEARDGLPVIYQKKQLAQPFPFLISFLALPQFILSMHLEVTPSENPSSLPRDLILV